MSKPVDLIIQNRLHDVAGDLVKLPDNIAAGANADAYREALARKMLCDIAHAAYLPKVLDALKMLGGPGTLVEAGQRLQAVMDSQRQQMRPTPATPADGGQQ